MVANSLVTARCLAAILAIIALVLFTALDLSHTRVLLPSLVSSIDLQPSVAWLRGAPRESPNATTSLPFVSDGDASPIVSHRTPKPSFHNVRPISKSSSKCKIPAGTQIVNTIVGFDMVVLDGAASNAASEIVSPEDLLPSAVRGQVQFPQKGTFLHIGANVGYHVLLFAFYGYTVVAVEPILHYRKALEASLCMNPLLKPLVTIVPAMVVTSEVIKDQECRANHTNNAVSCGRRKDMGPCLKWQKDCYDVPLQTLSTALEGMNITSVDIAMIGVFYWRTFCPQFAGGMQLFEKYHPLLLQAEGSVGEKLVRDCVEHVRKHYLYKSFNTDDRISMVAKSWMMEHDCANYSTVLRLYSPRVRPNCGRKENCLGLSTIPDDHAVDKMYELCGPRYEGYIRHNFFFAHLVMLSEELRLRTGVCFVSTHDAYNADVVLCSPGNWIEYVKQRNQMRERQTQQSVIFIEDYDGATVMTPTKIIEERSTLGVVKHHALKWYGGCCRVDGATISDCYQSWPLLAALLDPSFRHEVLQRYHKGEKKRQSHKSNITQVLPLPLEMKSLNGEPPIIPLRLSRSTEPLYPERAVAIVSEAGCTQMAQANREKIFVSSPSYFTVKHWHGNADTVFPPFDKLEKVSQRKIDVAFLGSLHTKELACSRVHLCKRSVGRHRETLLEALESFKQQRPDRVVVFKTSIPKAQFYETLRRVKIFVSPWGFGEWSGKDEEAVLNGAVLLKPGSALLDGWPRIYEPNVTCLDAHLDWRDLGAVLTNALSDLEHLEHIRKNAYHASSRFMTYTKASLQEEVLAPYASMVRSAAHQISEQKQR